MGQAKGAREAGAGSPEPLGTRSTLQYTKSRPGAVLSKPSETGLKNRRIVKRSLSKLRVEKSGVAQRADAL